MIVTYLPSPHVRVLDLARTHTHHTHTGILLQVWRLEPGGQDSLPGHVFDELPGAVAQASNSRQTHSDAGFEHLPALTSFRVFAASWTTQHDLHRMAEMAAALGEDADAAHYAGLLEKLKPEWHAAFWDPETQRYSTGATRGRP